MQRDLPQVIEFSHAYDVKIETTEHGAQRVVARVKPYKYDRGYKSFHDLPFVGLSAADNRYHWWLFPKAANWTEQKERGNYFWEEFVRYVRGHQKKRRQEAIWHTKALLPALFQYRDGSTEADTFAAHIAEALVAHLRVGLDEAKTEQQLAEEARA